MSGKTPKHDDTTIKSDLDIEAALKRVEVGVVEISGFAQADAGDVGY